MNRLGVWSASALCVIGVAYVVMLAVGFASAGFVKPIVDPVLAAALGVVGPNPALQEVAREADERLRRALAALESATSK